MSRETVLTHGGKYLVMPSADPDMAFLNLRDAQGVRVVALVTVPEARAIAAALIAWADWRDAAIAAHKAQP